MGVYLCYHIVDKYFPFYQEGKLIEQEEIDIFKTPEFVFAFLTALFIGMQLIFQYSNNG